MLFVLACVYTVYILLCTMYTVYSNHNKHLCCLNGVMSQEPLDSKLFEQILRAKTGIFDEIAKETGVFKHEQISTSALISKRHITKNMLARWLDSVCNLMNYFAVPRLQEAMKRNDEQTQEIIESKKAIIDLQAKVIHNKEEELAKLKSAVKDELKSVQGVSSRNGSV